MKKYIFPFIALVILCGAGCTPVTQSRYTSEKAVSAIKERYSELADYPSDSLPPRSITIEEDSRGIYVAFIQNGSGRPIIGARCFLVERNGIITEIGQFSPSTTTSVSHPFSAKECTVLSQ